MGHSVDRVDQNGMGIIEATENFVGHSGLLIARALLRPELGSVPLRIMNLSNEPYLLHKGTVVAKYEPVETEKFVKVNSLSQYTISSGESCSHIDDLITQSSSNLDESQKEKLRSLLYQFKDQFSKSSHDLGSTILVEHTIKTAPDCKPVKLRP